MKDFNNFEEKEGRIDFDDYDSDDFEDDFLPGDEGREIILVSDGEKQRIDVFLSDKLKESRNFVQKLISDGRVTVNERKVKANYKVKLKDTLRIIIPPPEVLDVAAEDIPLDIVYEDMDLAVINKAQGMVVHPAPGHYTGTLVNGLMYHLKDLSTINGVLRPGIVHRLDKNTSGLMLVAKNDKAHNFLAQCLKDHSIKRIYYALVQGNIKEDEGEINAPLGRSEKDRKKYTVTQKNSKEAITNYWVVERYGSYTLVKLRLKTGRTHQIRVHMAFTGHPLIADTVYGGGKTDKITEHFLHSFKLGFNHPITDEKLVFEAEMPEAFVKALKSLRVD
mgnify:CR=1 FL=1